MLRGNACWDAPSHGFEFRMEHSPCIRISPNVGKRGLGHHPILGRHAGWGTTQQAITKPSMLFGANRSVHSFTGS